MEPILEFESKLLPPSVNSMYVGTRYGKLQQNPKFRKYKDDLYIEWLSRGKPFHHDGKMAMRLEIEVGSPWWITQKGELSKIDVSNMIKCAEDGFAKALKYDDHFNWEVVAKKIICKVEFTRFKLFPIPELSQYVDQRFGMPHLPGAKLKRERRKAAVPLMDKAFR